MLVFLVASVTLNVAALGAFLFSRISRARHEQVFFRQLQAGAKGRLSTLFRQFEPKMDSLRTAYWDARRQLGMLGLEDKPDARKVDSLLNMIALLHKQMNRLVFETGSSVESLYPAERRERIRRRLMEMWEGPAGRRPGRRAFGRRFAPPPGEMPPPPPMGEEPPPGEGR